MQQPKADILQELKANILRLQGFKPGTNRSLDAALGSITMAFPNASFPLGAVHEFLCGCKEDIAATSGFIAGLLSSIAGTSGATLWISTSRMLFPPALKSFGLQPDRFIFLDIEKEKDVTWVMEEALKCPALAAVVGETQALDFTTSRRLQLAVEKSKVTGFVIQKNQHRIGTTTCVSRWKITSLNSDAVDELPGIGFPKWKAELLRIRNGKPGIWTMQWKNGKFITEDTGAISRDLQEKQRYAG